MLFDFRSNPSNERGVYVGVGLWNEYKCGIRYIYILLIIHWILLVWINQVIQPYLVCTLDLGSHLGFSMFWFTSILLGCQGHSLLVWDCWVVTFVPCGFEEWSLIILMAHSFVWWWFLFHHTIWEGVHQIFWTNYNTRPSLWSFNDLVHKLYKNSVRLDVEENERS